VEEALYESPVLRRFVGVDLGVAAPPDETTVCRFRHLLEKHDLGTPRDFFANCFGFRPRSLSTTVTQHSSDSLLTAKDCNSGDTVQSLAGLRHESEGPNVTSGRDDCGADISPTTTES
jgi:hypothetical protein